MSFYSDVFMESLGAGLIVPVSGQHTLFAMHGFGGYDMSTATLLAIAGAMGAMAADYAIGGFLSFMRRREKIVISEKVYEKGVLLANRRLLPLLLLSWLPLGALLSVAAGFFNVPAWKALSIMLIAQAGYYLYCGLF